MRLKMAARKSDLARMQLQTVAKFLQEKINIEPELIYRESFGDKNLDINLSGAENKGLFTQDFYQALVDKEIDLVVHSWKDLPIEDRETTIAMTLLREDARDLLLVKKSNLKKVRDNQTLSIMTSSPRREFFLQEHLLKLFPIKYKKIQFEAIRGNIPTRLNKLMKSESDGLVIAKAALDRMLTAEGDEYKTVKKEILNILDECQWMVLPLSLFPSAAAQGALAVEVLKGSEIEKQLKKLNCVEDFESVSQERKKLKELGGGCHSRLGVNYLSRSYGMVHYLSREVDGLMVSSEQLLTDKNWAPVPQDQLWPEPKSIESKRSMLSVSQELLASKPGLWVSRSLALPVNYQPSPGQKVWTSGVISWGKLADRGVWVHGCADSLGESEDMRLQNLLPGDFSWSKLTHSQGMTSDHEILTTYKVEWQFNKESFKGKTHFYWMSGRLFEEAIQSCPEILKGQHYCGPGHTFDILKKHLPKNNLHVSLGYEHWKREITK